MAQPRATAWSVLLWCREEGRLTAGTKGTPHVSMPTWDFQITWLGCRAWKVGRLVWVVVVVGG